MQNNNNIDKNIRLLINVAEEYYNNQNDIKLKEKLIELDKAITSKIFNSAVKSCE